MRTWLRAAGLGVAAGVWLDGRSEAVGWDNPWGPPTWQEVYIPLLVAGVGLHGYWRFLSWLTRRRLGRTGWRATRVIWPSAAVALIWLAALVGLSGAPEGIATTLGLVAAAVNFPLIPLVMLLSLLPRPTPWWVQAPIATAAAWFCWWAMVIFFERRARDAGPVTLGI